MATGRRFIIAAAVGATLCTAYVVYRRARTDDVPPVAQTRTARNAAPPGATPSATTDSKPRAPLDLPRSTSLPGGWEQQQVFVKPGHWSSMWIEGEATEADFRGRLSAELQGETGRTAQLAPWGRLVSERSLTLPRREPRVAELSFYAPNNSDPAFTPLEYGQAGRKPGQPSLQAGSLLRAAQLALGLGEGSTTELEIRLPVAVLRDHQGLLVVLAGKPDAYRFYGKLNFVAAPHSSRFIAPEQQAHYRVVIADDPQRAPLPSSMLEWTMTSAVIWDRYDPTRLTDAQRQALLDWLHWGGRLIISGPESLETLTGSFLAPYLPARSAGSLELDDEGLRPLDIWTIAGPDVLRPQPWRGTRLKLAPESRSLLGDADTPTPLVAERRTGRGCIVVTAFRLTQPDLVDWPSYDAFVHGCLLNRPARSWETVGGGAEKAGYARWSDNSDWYDPRRTSDLALAARGLAAPRLPIVEPAVGPGLAAWRDDDATTAAARGVLAEEAGLTIPRVGFIMGVVAAYFVVLVPVNWLIFSRLGKPQWAWGAAPLIAVGFSAFVIQSAQLDIGFARSAQELVVVEMQPGYTRGHVARWGVVYNSLGANYSFLTHEPTALVLPLTPGGPATAPVAREFVRDEGPTSGSAPRRALEGFLVESNSSAMYRAEQLLDCGGAISCEMLGSARCRLRNGTPWELEDLRIEGEFSAAAARLAPGGSIEMELRSAAPPASKSTKRDQLRAAVAGLPGDSLRLTAWTTAAPGDLTMQPQLSQFRSSTLVVAHLQYPPANIERDRNLPLRTPPASKQD